MLIVASGTQGHLGAERAFVGREEVAIQLAVPGPAAGRIVHQRFDGVERYHVRVRVNDEVERLVAQVRKCRRHRWRRCTARHWRNGDSQAGRQHFTTTRALIVKLQIDIVAARALIHRGEGHHACSSGCLDRTDTVSIDQGGQRRRQLRHRLRCHDRHRVAHACYIRVDRTARSRCRAEGQRAGSGASSWVIEQRQVPHLAESIVQAISCRHQRQHRTLATSKSGVCSTLGNDRHVRHRRAGRRDLADDQRALRCLRRVGA